MQDEENLVRRAQQYDQQAFAQLYEANFDKIYRYVAVKIGDRMEAEDVTQQVFLKALQSISAYKWKGVPFSAWLFRIAHNQIVDHLRKRKNQPATLFDETLVGSGYGNPQLITEHNMEVKRMVLATRRLSKLQREVISLRFAGELSIAEVAKIMGKSQGAVKALQHSAIVALRKILSVENNEETQGI
ncbi:sigma-70 family RNA polymerase sigma factor [Chloroflexota bacterium]